MKRRSFLAALFSAPMLPAVGAVLTNAGDGLKARALSDVKTEATLPALPLRSENIGHVTAGVIRSGDGRMVIDLSNGIVRIV